jgi:hypothetical protein
METQRQPDYIKQVTKRREGELGSSTRVKDTGNQPVWVLVAPPSPPILLFRNVSSATFPSDVNFGGE